MTDIELFLGMQASRIPATIGAAHSEQCSGNPKNGMQHLRGSHSSQVQALRRNLSFQIVSIQDIINNRCFSFLPTAGNVCESLFSVSTVRTFYLTGCVVCQAHTLVGGQGVCQSNDSGTQGQGQGTSIMRMVHSG